MENMDMIINEVTTAIEAMDPEVLAGGILLFAGLFAAIVALTVIRYLLIGLGYSKMYRKAGVAPWKAFIPIYHTYNNYKISWNVEMFALSVVMYMLVNSLGGSEALVPQLTAAVTGITLIAVVIKQNIMMAKLFGKGTGTGIALAIFPGITSLILGMGKAEFQAQNEND